MLLSVVVLLTADTSAVLQQQVNKEDKMTNI